MKELKRQYGSGLYERLALSRDKEGVRKLAREGQVLSRPEDMLKEPYVLEFLGLEEKERYSMVTQQFYSLLNTIGVCQFVWGPAWQLYGPGQLVDMVRAVTGWDVSLAELVTAGERALNMMRAFNAREGLTSADDKLPPKLFQPLDGGPSAGIAITEEEMASALSTYYAMCGWDNEGRPTKDKLDELGIGWVADQLGAA